MDSAEFHAVVSFLSQFDSCIGSRNAQVYEKVRLIPTGQVTTYGHIAKLIGMPRHSRHVGQALKFLNPGTNPPVPWQRVIGSSGTISSRGPGTDGARRQRDALVAEGVEVTETRDGEFKVSLRDHGWFPAVPTPIEQRAESPDNENAALEE
ncbi:Alkyltransferase-like protein 1 [Leucoagaricus sp. SymC.cos]|nr:Alkyltransferase-like protein 1 [Leucoagaricus sp. SymC.cos]